MNKRAGVAIALALLLALLSQGCGKRGITCPEPKPECTPPLASVSANNDTVFIGTSVTIAVKTKGAHHFDLYLKGEGRPDTLLATSSDSTFTMHMVMTQEWIGNDTLKVVAWAREGCEAEAKCPLTVRDYDHFCEGEGNLKPDDALWKEGCFEYPPAPRVRRLRIWAKFGRHLNSDMSKPDTVWVAAGFQGSKIGERPQFFWSKQPNGSPIWKVVIPPYVDRMIFELGVVELPGNDLNYGGVLANPAFTELGPDRIPWYTGVTTFFGFGAGS